LLQIDRKIRMHYVYILRSKFFNRQLYVGMTTNCNRRLSDHNEGRSCHTAKFRPWELVYTEKFECSLEAVRRERQVKKWSRGKKEALIAGDFVRLKELSLSTPLRQAQGRSRQARK
jgi:putative endonuclease